MGTPWENRGKCHMDEKRIQCLSNASQHPSNMFNRFPVIQPVSSKDRHFSTFLHILASLGTPLGHGKCYMDGKRIQCWSNASLRRPIPIYLQPFLRYSKLLVENCDIFIPHLCLAPPQGVTPSKFREDVCCW